MSASRSEPVRVVTILEAPAVRSQAVYHAVGESLSESGPDTILLVRPAQPYVCIGFHQDAATELDLGACKQLGLPVIRREVGGGAVYLDSNQLFVQWVFRPSRLPRTLFDRYRLYVEPLVDTYRSLGVQAEYRPINDIHVSGRKIGGTGAARLGGSEVVVGSIMADFDHYTMSRVLNIASEKMRDKVATAMGEYVTSLHRELGEVIDLEQVTTSYLAHAAQSLGRALEPGELTAEETAALDGVERRLSSDAWTYRHTRRAGSAVKIHEDITVREGVHKAAAGLVQIVVVIQAGVILDAQVFGDFTLIPQGALPAIEEALKGIRADPEVASSVVRDLYAKMNLDAPGLEPEDFGAALTAALGKS